MSIKRKRVVLSLKEKMAIIESLNSGQPGNSLAEKYGVGISTISDIKKNKENIAKYFYMVVTDDGDPERKSMKKPQNVEIEDALFVWFVQKCSSGHGIREIEIHGEILSSDLPSANAFTDTFKNFLKEQVYDEEFIYNADETGLNWKQLPNRSLVPRRENAAPGYKTSKKRVTIMVCANSTGRHRLPLFVIGKWKKPRCFKNLKSIPVSYDHQKNAWMNGEIFKRWYENIFIPEVKKYQNSIDKHGKVLLLLDNAPSHPCVEYLNHIDKMFSVKFLPPNVTPILQPMDQGVIETLKRIYRKQLLRALLLADDSNEDVLHFFKQITLKDCCYMLAESWSYIEVTTLKNGWNKLLKRAELISVTNDVTANENVVTKLTEKIRQISICNECNEEDVGDWLKCDVCDPGFQILNDDEIIESFMKSNVEEEEAEVYDDENIGPSHSTAFQSLEVAMEWFERQEECDSKKLLILKGIRDLAAKKRKETFKQKTITDYFNKE